MNPHLSTIAGLIGVPVESLSAPRAPFPLHESGNGDRWLLVPDADGVRVRHIGNPASGGHVTECDLAAFLARDRGSPECAALLRLIDASLARHLGF